MGDALAMPPPPAPPRVQVYRAALGDARGRIIGSALVMWIAAHVILGAVIAARTLAMRAPGAPPPLPPDQPVWFSPPHLQIGVRAFQFLGSSFLDSIAWQIGGILFLLVGVIVILTHRLRIVALAFPPLFFLAAALCQSIAYNVHNPYWAQGNPLFTLLFASVAVGTTYRLAPRNSGWRELRTMARELLRQTAQSPGAQIFGPIFAKEVRVLGRRRGTYWVRALYPLGLLALVALVYAASTADIDRFSGGAERLQRIQEIAPTLALFITWAQYVMLLFIAAALTAPAVCDERRTRTLASLMTTPMSAAQIVIGKLTSRLVQLLIIGLVSVPFLLGIRVFGGLEPEVIFALIAITITSTFLMASLGILASVWSRKPASATAMALMFFLLLTFAPVVVVVIASLRAGGGPPDEILAFSSPMAMIAATFYITGGGPQIVLRELWVANSIINIALGLGALFIAGVSLRGVMLSEAALEAPAARSRRRRRRAAAPPASPAPAPDSPDTTPAETHEILVDRETIVPDQPILWRELRQPALGSRRMMIITACIVVALILWLYAEVSPAIEEPHAVVLVVGMLLLTIQAAVVSTPAVTNEKDGSTWQTLLTTPLTPAQILLPKLIGSIKKLWFIAAFIGAGLMVGVLAGVVHPVIYLHLAMIILTLGVFLGGTGILFSLLARRSTSAGLFNILLAGALWLGLPIGGAMMEEFVLRHTIGRTPLLEKAVFIINPIALTVAAGMGSINTRPGWETRVADGTSLSLFEFTSLLGVVCAVGCCLGLLAVWVGCTRFNKLTERTS